MKVTLDLSKLVEEKKLSPAEAERLSVLAAGDTYALAINILVGFGIVAVSAGTLALLPTLLTVLVLGLVLSAIGLAFTLQGKERWSLLAQIFLVVGVLLFCGGVYALGDGSLAAMLIVTAMLAGTAIVARSGLLMAAAVLALAGCLGANAGYASAAYMLTIFEPLVTIVLFSFLALLTYYLSKSLAADYERLALIAARTSIFMVNFGFWIGSLLGDYSPLLRALLAANSNGANSSAVLGPSDSPPLIPPLPFVIGWAVALVAVGIWAVRENRRWVVNIVAVFAAIHFYTQWFERLGFNPITVLAGGLLMLAFALGLWKFNKRFAEGFWSMSRKQPARRFDP
jgi:iron complex transport system permease protein